MIWNAGVEQAPRAELRALQLHRLRTAVAWACERVAFHRSAFAEAGLDPGAIKSLDDLERLPFTRKADLRDHYRSPTGTGSSRAAWASTTAPSTWG